MGADRHLSGASAIGRSDAHGKDAVNEARRQPARFQLVAMAGDELSLPLHPDHVHGVLPKGAPHYPREKGNDMEVFVGVDVSLASTAICVLGEKGKIVSEARVASAAKPLVAFMHKPPYGIAAIGLEAGPLSQWLHKALIRNRL